MDTEYARKSELKIDTNKKNILLKLVKNALTALNMFFFITLRITKFRNENNVVNKSLPKLELLSEEKCS